MMKYFQSIVAVSICLSTHSAHAVDSTDTLMDGDSEQSGYLANHRMDPAVIQGGSFGQIWHYTTPSPSNSQSEQFYAKPLVYTPSSTGQQIVLAFSEQNRIYALDAVNGTLYASRDLGLEGEIPFMVSDLGSCNDISGTIGITGTPVIDPTTDTVFFWAKSYNGNATGYQNGAYRFHGVDAATLEERPGFPVNIQGQPADNDNTRIFTGGTVLQRPSLNLVNGIVFAGFGGHCDQYNYTGVVVGMNTSGAHVTSYATSGGPGAPPQDGTWTGGGGGCGIWMSGMPISSDESGRIFFATGNGIKNVDNQQQPASGRVHLDTLSECLVNMAIDPETGVLSQQDYFEPYAYMAMDSGDRDLGASGVCLPDPATFSGGGVAKIAIICGKNGQCYVVNRDNLGGYKLGPSGDDAVLQVITTPTGGSIFANGGTYPLEGGYLYVTPVGAPTYVYSLGFSSSGLPVFTLVAQTSESASGSVGIGPPTITTNDGQEGTGIMWIADPGSGLRAYNAVPLSGNMTRIPLPVSLSVAKFQRPVFGNGRYYLSTSDGQILAYGSPVALPLTCNSIDFGIVQIGNYSTLNISCVANITITSLEGLFIGNNLFQAANSSLPRGPLAVGATFSFPVLFNLTDYELNAGSTGAPTVSPGTKTTSLFIFTMNGEAGFSSEVSISLTGKIVSSTPFASLSPLEVDFPGLVIGSAAATAGSSSTFIISNVGQTVLTIVGYAWTIGDVSSSSGNTNYTNVTTTKDSNGNTQSVLDSDGYFTSSNLPAVGTTILGGSSITVNALFNTSDIGDYFSTFFVFSNGGSTYTILTGAASTPPIAVLQYSTSEEGWQAIPDCAIPADGCTNTLDLGSSLGLTLSSITIRFTNNGGSALIVTKSKPPEGTYLFANDPETDLSEGLVIPPGNSSSAAISFQPGASTLNSDNITFSEAWTLNTNDLNFGIHTLNFTGTLISNKTGPMTADGRALYKFLGCYQDNVDGVRIESQKEYVNTNNTNGLCQNQTYSNGAVFAGTEYMQECWVGSVIPNQNQLAPPSACNYFCSGDTSQTCGGNGGFISIYYDSSRYFPSNGTITGTSGQGPANVESLGQYNYYGCWTDNQTARVLFATGISLQTNTLEKCAAFCNQYSIFGTEYSEECYCGNMLASSSTLRQDSECTMTCAGNETEFCGASNRLSVYTRNVTASVLSSQSAITTTTSAATSPTVGAYTYVACQSDLVNQRTLTASTTTSGTMTIELCAKYCSGYIYFGVEYSQECYCGNSLTSGSTAATDGRCSMTCAGKSSEVCGGSNGLSLYQLTTSLSNPSLSSDSLTSTTSTSVTFSATTLSTTNLAVPTNVHGYNYIDCHSDTVSDRTLQGNYVGSNNMTIENCASFCTGFIYFGVEYAEECYCGNILTTGSSTTTDGRCDMECAGNAGEICGGPNGLTLFENASLSSSSSPLSSFPLSHSSTSSLDPSKLSPTSSSTSSSTAGSIISFSSSSTTSSTSTSSQTSSSGSSPIVSSNSWIYAGCANDTVSDRSLSAASMTNTTSMTIESCQNYCIKQNYPLAGLEYSSECYCGLYLGYNSVVGKTGCIMTCSGNSTEICGGSNRLSVYNYTSYITPSISPAIGPYIFQGCYLDSTSARGLSAYSFTDGTSMTSELCVMTCQAKGYSMAGLEYGQECYCGNVLASSSTAAPGGIKDCEVMFCPGNEEEFCAAGNRLLVYTNGK